MFTNYKLCLFVVIFIVIGREIAYSNPIEFTVPTFVSKEGWGGRETNDSISMTTPVSNVVIHHTYLPRACESEEACIKSVKSIQNYHMDDRKWKDIGYSFLIGGDNRIYIGRGWDTVGAHAVKYNRNSIGISIIGDWRSSLPPASQLQVVKDLITYGIQIGKITNDYRLLGHRQASATECPGEALYQEIQTWPHWSK